MEINKSKLLMSQINKYGLDSHFKCEYDYNTWLDLLSGKEINNLLSLTIHPIDLPFSTKYLIDEDLLKCDDYIKRVEALSKLTNIKECENLLDNLLHPNVLKSNYFYKDVEKISLAKYPKYILEIINKDAFINSPYHEKDLDLIINAKDTLPEDDPNNKDYLVLESLAMVASNKFSIESIYHEYDMDFISKKGSKALQSRNEYPYYGVNYLACNEISLKDDSHIKNMNTLERRNDIGLLLFPLMTNEKIVKGKNYTKEIDELSNSKSHANALAIYSYITNPVMDKKRLLEYLIIKLNISIQDTLGIEYNHQIEGSLNVEYLNNLTLLNILSPSYVLYVESLLANHKFINSPYHKLDMNVLLSNMYTKYFYYLYRVMINETSLYSKYHAYDIDLIINSKTDKHLFYLTLLATNETSLKSHYHKEDMEYISDIDFENITPKEFDNIYHCIFEPRGIKSDDHLKLIGIPYENEPVIEQAIKKEDNKVLTKIKKAFKLK